MGWTGDIGGENASLRALSLASAIATLAKRSRSLAGMSNKVSGEMLTAASDLMGVDCKKSN